ncbi:MAG: YihY/virulence factor BrkB family protein [Acidobacteriota bacterium]|nr:YihY/virulence factor BrkB family protein [Acidobacteriota bacterium]
MLREIRELFQQTFSEWNNHDAATMGAALAYYTVLSLAPLLIVAVSIAGMIYGQKAATGEIVNQVSDLVGPGGAEVIQSILANARSPAKGTLASVIGIVTLLFGASGVFKALRDSLNRMWGVKHAGRLGIWETIRREFSTFGMVLAIGFLLVVSLVVSAFVTAVGKFLHGKVPVGLLLGSNTLVSVIVITLLFALIYRVVPSTRIRWSDVWVGSAVTAVLFTIGKYLIGLYLSKASVGSAYGAAGSLVALLVWVYYSAQIFLFGAEFTHVYAQLEGSRSGRSS